MQGKTLESCDFLELQVTNKLDKSTKQNLSLEKPLEKERKRMFSLLSIAKRKNNEKGNAVYTFSKRTKKFKF